MKSPKSHKPCMNKMRNLKKRVNKTKKIQEAHYFHFNFKVKIFLFYEIENYFQRNSKRFFSSKFAFAAAFESK